MFNAERVVVGRWRKEWRKSRGPEVGQGGSAATKDLLREEGRVGKERDIQRNEKSKTLRVRERG